MFYTISQLAKKLGVHKNTIFYWEQTGKIPKPKREKVSGYRVWSEQDVAKIKAIKDGSK